ncbi:MULTISPECIES: NAD(P)/FAD-dependent oxidoreductase [unclassified Luteibacter]|uniref:FAD-dependent oxidoreductase n=1 Tax=unclassified Luteibacter TaxID=2620188 RepID=UPI0008D31CA4|nr:MULTISPECIES: NAD(P)/FAD-dependent oxidoreductase [unclassified Luteibacter]MDR6935496.1 kynurenine 3-monooxygenase [Luteibacter sp. 3190]SEV94864.1 kynurenine 3-monooxygenase [Luteibacter sp. 329MFSha]
MPRNDIAVVGAGLVGALVATLLTQRGFRVTVYERRSDPRLAGFEGGRSINLALAERGLHALRATGLAEKVLDQAVMMRGRMVHDPAGHSGLQRYGVDDSEVIWSVSRGGLNTLMLDAAEAAGATIHFDQGLVAADLDAGTLTLGAPDGTRRTVDAPVVIGADGAGSALRAAMHAHSPLGERVEELGHGYKELEIPPGRDPSAPFAIERNALHIWPRGHYMSIALPNREGSFTVTLFLPNDGPHPSFRTIAGVGAAEAFFRADFPDALALMPDFAADWAAHPVGTLGTLYLDRWHIGGRALLIGDAAHAIVPFHGQGMNCGFEDAAELAELFAATPDDPAAVFAAFEARRKPNADAIATMALENYVEMRDSVADPHYLRKRELGALLAERSPTHYLPRYRMVTFTHLPYAYALERGRAQDTLLEQLLKGHDSVASVDIDAAVRALEATLPPLPL